MLLVVEKKRREAKGHRMVARIFPRFNHERFVMEIADKESSESKAKIPKDSNALKIK